MIGSLIIALSLIPSGAGPTPSPVSSPTPFTLSEGQQARGFIRYIPNKQGDMTWEMRGDVAHLLSPTLTEITGLVAISHDPQVGDMKITVARFIFDSKTREGRAQGERVNVRREKMVLTGKGMLWLADRKNMRIMEDVKVLIKEKEHAGLFPFDLPALSLAKAPPPGQGPTPPPDWTVITADGNLFMDYRKNMVTFFRNVRVNNPRGRLRSDRMIIFVSARDKKMEKVEAFGNVTIDMGERSGSSDKLLYLPEEKKVILLGNAMVRDKKNRVRGKKITFFLDKEEMEVSSVLDINLTPDKDMDFNLGD